MNKLSKSNKDAQSRTERKKQSKKIKKNKMSLGKKILFSIIGFILAIGVGGLGLFAYYASSAPELTNDDLTGSYSSEFVDMNGEVFYTLGGDKREYADADEYPEVMLNAIKAIEDTRFERHIGIDPIGISRAAVGYLTNAGEIVGGGSTITQQLIKWSVFSTDKEDQTLKRKAQEAWLAIQLERQLSKEQIMTLYLNRIHMGSNVYGVATAAEEYYGKDISELELYEAAMFAAMPKAPNYYNPYTEPEIAKERRDLVLDEMVDYGAITQETADENKEIPIDEGLIERKEDPEKLVFDAYISEVIEEVNEKTDYDPYTAGLTIHTNYDPNAQNLLYDVVNSNEYVNFPNDELQTAVTLIDSTSGKLTALIGGRKLEGKGQSLFNRATRNNRSVGSTMKPLSTYGPAIEFNQFSTYHQVVDESYTIGDWTPRNYDRVHKGQMAIREALVDSRNIPTAKIFNEDLDWEKVEGFLEGLGIDVENLSGNSSDGLVRSNAIDGTMTPLELTGAYTAFANEGNYTEPYAVSKIINQDGEETDLTPETTKAMEDYTAYMVTDILKGVIPHYGNQLDIPGYVQAAKTGTSNYSEEEIAEHAIPSGSVPDNWVVGYSPYYTMSVWMGYDQKFKEGHQLKASDGSIRLSRDVYKAAMSQLVSNLERRDWQKPNSVVELSIENGSMPAKYAAENSKNAVKELFVKGSSEIPDKTAEPEFELSAPTGLKARYDAENDTASITWNAVKLPAGLNEDLEYILTINDDENKLEDTEYVFQPEEKEYNISVAIQVGNERGPKSRIQLLIPKSEDEDNNEDIEDDSEDDGEDADDENDNEDNIDNNEDNENNETDDDKDKNDENNENNGGQEENSQEEKPEEVENDRENQDPSEDVEDNPDDE